MTERPKFQGPKTAGEFLRSVAKKKGISTKTIAEGVRVHPSTVRRTFRDWDTTANRSQVKQLAAHVIGLSGLEWDIYDLLNKRPDPRNNIEDASNHRYIGKPLLIEKSP